MVDGHDFDEILAAVMETARGRWFLAEFANRNRTADTRVLLDAIGRLERSLSDRNLASDDAGLRVLLDEMSEAIAKARRDIGELGSPDRPDAEPTQISDQFERIVRTTETATSDILEATETVQEVAWCLREAGVDPDICDTLDQRATAIYTACAFQDLTAQRVGKVLGALRIVEDRLRRLDRVSGVRAPTGSRPDASLEPPGGLSQTAIDFVLVQREPADQNTAAPPPARDEAEPLRMPAPDKVAAPAVPEPSVPEPHADRRVKLSALAAIDKIPFRERLRLFT